MTFSSWPWRRGAEMWRFVIHVDSAFPENAFKAHVQQTQPKLRDDVIYPPLPHRAFYESCGWRPRLHVLGVVLEDENAEMGDISNSKPAAETKDPKSHMSSRVV